MLKNSLIGVWHALKYDAFIWSHGLRRADKIATDMTGPEKIALYRLVCETKPQVIVEIGSYLGASSSFMARAAQKSSPGCRLYCVDTWQNDAMPEGQRDTFAEFSRHTESYQSLIRPLRQRSDTAARDFEGSIDLLFIDGDHEYAGVKLDWDSWLPHLRDQATVVMHDVGWAAGVQRVVDESILPISSDVGRLPNLFWSTVRKSSSSAR
ncbi:class I SAM-dependent methyltransferase [Allorhodopirellula heiligendammensis]|uniref:Cephalosporin hydroxylase n=1 Tax=Allorhodopirellula heiligendammensis TaxID=2714739 RepID=A0A5C6BXR7_9BACT|nr:class I SAM-dependent methyltransferase [Allorhodopirellula heiligendammensis]TWU16261.1 hypothetical protein Poly21_34660 [Allorhodopirellula heiligendammensis]